MDAACSRGMLNLGKEVSRDRSAVHIYLRIIQRKEGLNDSSLHLNPQGNALTALSILDVLASSRRT